MFLLDSSVDLGMKMLASVFLLYICLLEESSSRIIFKAAEPLELFLHLFTPATAHAV
jgi:hypothetical protein